MFLINFINSINTLWFYLLIIYKFLIFHLIDIGIFLNIYFTNLIFFTSIFPQITLWCANACFDEVPRRIDRTNSNTPNVINNFSFTIIPPLHSSFDTGEKIPLKLWINFHTAFPLALTHSISEAKPWTNAKKTIKFVFGQYFRKRK